MSKELIEFTDKQNAVIRTQFFPQSATAEEMQYCMQVAKDLGLNPILKEIYFVERKAKVGNNWITKIEPLAGKNAWLKLAHNSGDFEGLEVKTELKEMPMLNNGLWESKKDLVAIATVYKKSTSMPFITEVSFSEYAQRKNDGSYTKFWKEKPQTMLKKVAVAQALREAFSVSGIYDESEIEALDELSEYKAPALQEKVEPKRKRRTKAEIEAERKTAQDEINKEVEEHQDTEVTEAVIEEPTSSKKMLRGYYPTLLAKGLSNSDLNSFIGHFGLNNDNAEDLLDNEAELVALVEEFNSIPL